MLLDRDNALGCLPLTGPLLALIRQRFGRTRARVSLRLVNAAS